MLERSNEAPMHWDDAATEAVVRETVLDERPDVVMFQELPGLVPFVETHTMVPANPRSHSGNLATLVTHRLAPSVSVTVVERCAVLTTFADLDLTIANVHLVPGKGAGPDRLMQLTRIIEASPTKPLVVAGDTNMRIAEVNAVVDLGFTSDQPPVPTWDSRRNRFRPDIPEFRAYFTRWFAGPGVSVVDVSVHDRPVEHHGHTFHLSDHFALSGTIRLD